MMGTVALRHSLLDIRQISGSCFLRGEIGIDARGFKFEVRGFKFEVQF
jgi:hypothetical protein